MLTLEQDIRALLDAPAEGEAAPHVDLLEETLTTGYARALALEAERLRIDSRIRDLAAAGAAADGDELAALAAQSEDAHNRHARLRDLLAPLRDRANAARVGAC